MPSDFTQLIADIEREAHAEGPRAVRELERLRGEFRLASAHVGIISGLPEGREAADALGNNLGNKLSETQKHSEAQNPTNTGSIN